MAAAAGARLRAFHDAQNAGHPTIYDRALAELRDGRKRSHWIWFVLPQLAGLGRSAMAQRYGIADLDEARAYLADPVLRQRLEAVIGVIDEKLRKPGQSLEHLMGSGLDAAKTVSSLTLFEAAGSGVPSPPLPCGSTGRWGLSPLPTGLWALQNSSPQLPQHRLVVLLLIA